MIMSFFDTRRGRQLEGSPPPELIEVAASVGRGRVLDALGVYYEQVWALDQWVERFVEVVKREAGRSGVTLRTIRIPCAGGCGACNFGKWRTHIYWQVYESAIGDYRHIRVQDERSFLTRFVSDQAYHAYMWVNQARLTLLSLYRSLLDFERFVGCVSEDDVVG